jgi:hypothetical protein
MTIQQARGKKKTSDEQSSYLPKGDHFHQKDSFTSLKRHIKSYMYSAECVSSLAYLHKIVSIRHLMDNKQQKIQKQNSKSISNTCTAYA